MLNHLPKPMLLHLSSIVLVIGSGVGQASKLKQLPLGLLFHHLTTDQDRGKWRAALLVEGLAALRDS